MTRTIAILLLLAQLHHGCSAAAPAPTPVHTVHLTFSHHLDVGLDLPLKITADCVGFATKIVQRYFDVFIPGAIKLAQKMNGKGERRFRYQIHPWVGSLYADCIPWAVSDGCKDNPGTLVCPSNVDVAAFGAALRRGDLVFAASPFNVNVEAVGEPSLLAGLVDVAAQLEDRFNMTTAGARVWSNVDVKGFARSAIPLLRAAGVETLYIGTNGGPHRGGGQGLQPVCGAENATMFRWVDPPSGAELTVLYVDGYGSYLGHDVGGAGTVSASSAIVAPNGVALVSYFATDNAGPPSTALAVEAIHARVAELFPGASVVASSFNEFAAAALTPPVVAALPRTSVDWGGG
jgi:hypothetical protein